MTFKEFCQAIRECSFKKTNYGIRSHKNFPWQYPTCPIVHLSNKKFNENYRSHEWRRAAKLLGLSPMMARLMVLMFDYPNKYKDSYLYRECGIVVE